MTVIENKLKELNIVLPEAPKPVGSYETTIQVGLLVFTSGILPVNSEGEVKFTQQIDSSTVEDGQRALLCALKNALSILKQKFQTLDNIERIVRLAGYINSQPGFCQQSDVINPASKLLIALWGDKGKHVRTTIGVSELPLGASVEIELIVQVKNIS
ncbi:MAG: RidA family protein [Candidatus Caenarcaniphilales bacterium]|nr:RidA family protein [Candidatus Caenarcaniphilales bacterium]